MFFNVIVTCEEVSVIVGCTGDYYSIKRYYTHENSYIIIFGGLRHEIGAKTDLQSSTEFLRNFSTRGFQVEAIGTRDWIKKDATKKHLSSGVFFSFFWGTISFNMYIRMNK